MLQDTKKTAQKQAVASQKTGLTVSYNSLTENEKILLHFLFYHFCSKQKSLINFKDVSSKRMEYGFALSKEILTGNKRKHKHQRSRHYLKALDGLIDKGIVERDNKFFYDKDNPSKSYCKKLRFTQSFVQSDGALDLLITLVKFQRVRTNNKLRRSADTNVRKLRLKKGVAIHSTIEQLVTPEFIKKKFVRYSDVYDSLQHGVYWVVLDGRTLERPLTLSNALRIAGEEELQVFYKVRERIIIIDKPNFLNTKLLEIRLVYSIMLENVLKKNFFPASISGTNKRLTTFFTIFPNSLLDQNILEFDKKTLLTYDISNSQFAFLANILKSYDLYLKTGYKNPLYKKIEQETEYLEALGQSFESLQHNGKFKEDVSLFLRAACDGQLYEEIVNIHNSRSDNPINRGLAKVGMFIVGFAAHTHNPPLKKAIREVYPSVIQFIDLFKKLKPNKDKTGFAVFLQRIESSICVDEVLKNLQSKYTILTRHDSWTIPMDGCNSEQFRLDLVEQLSKYLEFGYNLKLEKAKKTHF
jgi:hypothetical protein